MKFTQSSSGCSKRCYSCRKAFSFMLNFDQTRSLRIFSGKIKILVIENVSPEDKNKKKSLLDNCWELDNEALKRKQGSYNIELS